ncbi:Radical SAM family enzyme [Altererythrobacter epoxidivorans]|uniref:Heme chaperone HemW n=1 Tax=Altererythrobacter epoxidivorans TaxID=361183 RepID=A0A0M5L6S8_9SPHN|nr:radical SAM family heme chaperone HemW [Altererythrobacter epoxidivorans]ALE16444.1 Radical SAM family enzyme [Altererythrobacter epoxidivorans]
MTRALYIHWPFCARKCPYCDFNSHVRASVDMAAWEKALIADLKHEALLAPEQPIHSIFFGGGTPSLMPPELVGTLLGEAERLWGFTPDVEITLEANPSSVEAANFRALADAGVNRVSLGIQSLDDEILKFLGRLHSAGEALAALETAQGVFDRVSFDLIYARPGQTPDEWAAELQQALGFGTGHLSLYQLTIEPSTRFETDVRLGKFNPLDDDPAADLYALTQQMTEAAGLPAYEISNHARPGEESRHNLTYWRYGDYFGVGPGAHGRRLNRATERHKKPENYPTACEAHGHGTKHERILAINEQASEALLVGLRLMEGIDLENFAARFEMSPDALVDREKLSLFVDLGLMWQEGSRIGLTTRGMPLLDALLGQVVGDGLVEA